MQEVTESLIPCTVNTPLDARHRINTIQEIYTIPRPYIGMLVYVVDEDEFVVVTALDAMYFENGASIPHGKVKDYRLLFPESTITVSNGNLVLDGAGYAANAAISTGIDTYNSFTIYEQSEEPTGTIPEGAIWIQPTSS